MKKLIQRYADADDVAFVTVQTVFEGFGTNDAKAAKRTADKLGLKIPVGHDAGAGRHGNGSRIMKSYRTRGTPWVVVVDKRGVVRYNAFHISPKNARTLIDLLRLQGG